MKCRSLPALVLTAILLALPALSESQPYQDGVYQDLAPGYNGDVIITVEVRNGRIVSLDAKNSEGGESEYFLKARDGLSEAIIAAQGLSGVEAVSGATGTSESILSAMEGMLLQLRYQGGTDQ